MKDQSDLSTLTLTELNKRAKSTKMASGLLIGIIIVQFITGIFLTLKQGFSVFILIPVAFLPMVAVNYSNLKKINEEIAKRKSQFSSCWNLVLLLPSYISYFTNRASKLPLKSLIFRDGRRPTNFNASRFAVINQELVFG